MSTEDPKGNRVTVLSTSKKEIESYFVTKYSQSPRLLKKRLKSLRTMSDSDFEKMVESVREATLSSMWYEIEDFISTSE